jgi:hypothetical protein
MGLVVALTIRFRSGTLPVEDIWEGQHKHT